MIKKNQRSKHELSPIPTAYEESNKIIDSKDVKSVREKIESKVLTSKNSDLMKYKKDEKFILNLINTSTQTKFPLVDALAIEQATYTEALKSLINLKNTDVLESMMLLYEYMEKKNTFKLNKITGTELLKLGGYTNIRQKHRSSILEKIWSNRHSKISILKPEKSIKNFKNKKTEKGLVYQEYELIKIKETVRSKKNPQLIVELTGVEFLPEYIEHIHKISKRYLPLKTIRKIPKDCYNDKTRYFLYKLCFKFAGMKKNQCDLTLDECMNLGKFFNKKEKSPIRKWQPIEKALIRAKNVHLIQYIFNFREVTNSEIHRDELEVNSFNEIISYSYNESGELNDKFYKYIKSVTIIRVYELEAPVIELPYALEEPSPSRDISSITA